jgi:hypothetical protein
MRHLAVLAVSAALLVPAHADELDDAQELLREAYSAIEQAKAEVAYLSKDASVYLEEIAELHERLKVREQEVGKLYEVAQAQQGELDRLKTPKPVVHRHVAAKPCRCRCPTLRGFVGKILHRSH